MPDPAEPSLTPVARASALADEQGFSPLVRAFHVFAPPLERSDEPIVNQAGAALYVLLQRSAERAVQKGSLGEQDAEDAVQTTLERLAKRGPLALGPLVDKVRTDVQVKSYLKSAVVNYKRDRGRRDKHRGDMPTMRTDEGTKEREIVEVGLVGGADMGVAADDLARVEALVFDQMGEASVQDLARPHRDGRRLALAQLRQLYRGERTLDSLADACPQVTALGQPQTPAEEKARKREWTRMKENIQTATRRARIGLELQCRRFLEGDRLERASQRAVDDLFERMGSPRVTVLWRAERVVFDRLWDQAVARMDASTPALGGPSDVERMAPYRDKLRRLCEKREGAAVQLRTIAKKAERPSVERLLGEFRAALEAAARAAVSDGSVRPRRGIWVDGVLETLGAKPSCVPFLAGRQLFDKLPRRGLSALGRDHAGEIRDTLPELWKRAIGRVELAELARAASQDIETLRARHERALALVERCCRKALRSSQVARLLWPWIDPLLAAVGGQPVCRQWQAEEVLFERLEPRVTKALTPKEVERWEPAAATLRLLARREHRLVELVAAQSSLRGVAREGDTERLRARLDWALRKLEKAVGEAHLAAEAAADIMDLLGVLRALVDAPVNEDGDDDGVRGSGNGASKAAER